MKTFFVASVVFCVAAAQLRQLNPAPLSVQRTKDCPAGYELVGKQCVNTEVLPHNYVCPAGTTELLGECATFTRARRVCNTKGTSLVGEQCSSTTVIPASYECNEGDVQGSQCRVTTAIEPVCPPGTQRRNDECVRFTAQSKTCPPPFQLEGKECVQRQSFEAAPVCPSGFNLEGDKKCTKVIPQPPRCPPGLVLNGLTCVREVSKVPGPCPKGYTTVGNQCKYSTEFPTRPVCQEGYVLEGDKCVKTIPIPSSCPSGTSRDSVNQCTRQVAKNVICDDGETLVGSQCRRVSLFSSDLECPADFHLVHGKCKKADRTQPVQRCDVGVFTDGACVTEAPGTPLLGCPNGFSLVKGPRCQKTSTYDCSKTVTRTECEMPAFAASKRRLFGDYKAKVAAVAPHKKEVPVQQVNKSPVCQQVPHVIPQTCTKTEEAPLQYVCPDGSAPVGKNCPVVSTAAASPYCTVGQYDAATGDCVEITVVPAKKVCAVGQLKDDDTCEKVDLKPAAQICPDGSTPVGKDGSCIVTEPEVTHPDVVVNSAPQKVCDIGTRQGKICVQTETQPRDPICPPGSTDNGKGCAVTTSAIQPDPIVIHQNPSYACSKGSVLVGKSCTVRDSVPAEYICKEGSKEGSRCVHSAELIYVPPRVTFAVANPVCPPGFTQRGDACSLTETQPAELECPQNYVRYDKGVKECTRAVARIPTCAAGTQQTKEGCVKKSYQPPRVTEIKICTKGQSGC